MQTTRQANLRLPTPLLFTLSVASDRAQEIIGEIGTAILLKVLGFQHAIINMDAAGHGPDVVAQESHTGLWGVFESKGGSGRLGNASYGKQMGKEWITHWLKKLIADNPGSQGGQALANAFYTTKTPMLAVITRLNLALKRDQVKIGAQIYLPTTGAGMHDWKGF